MSKFRFHNIDSFPLRRPTAHTYRTNLSSRSRFGAVLSLNRAPVLSSYQPSRGLALSSEEQRQRDELERMSAAPREQIENSFHDRVLVLITLESLGERPLFGTECGVVRRE